MALLQALETLQALAMPRALETTLQALEPLPVLAPLEAAHAARAWVAQRVAAVQRMAVQRVAAQLVAAGSAAQLARRLAC